MAFASLSYAVGGRRPCGACGWPVATAVMASHHDGRTCLGDGQRARCVRRWVAQRELARPITLDTPAHGAVPGEIKFLYERISLVGAMGGWGVGAYCWSCSWFLAEPRARPRVLLLILAA